MSTAHLVQEASMITTEGKARICRDREFAREYLTKKIEGARRNLADPHSFSTIDPNYLIEDAEWRLRWIDCAPEGANFGLAPLQDKRGVPMGGVYDENVGPSRALRDAWAKRGLDWQALKTAQAQAA